MPRRSSRRALTPNDPRKRFEWVIATYWGKSYKGESLNGVVLDAFYVTTSLLGTHELSDRPHTTISHEPGSLSVRYTTDEIPVERIQARLDAEANQRTAPKGAQVLLKRLGHPYEYHPLALVGTQPDYDSRRVAEGYILWDSEQWGLADLVLQVVQLPERAPPDFLIPWIARELVKLAKHVLDWSGKPASSAFQRDYWTAVHALYDKAPAIAQWAQESRTDIGKVDLATALEAIATYKFKQSLIEQGEIVYKYADGWTVQELRTERALTQEGEQMQNCIGGYCGAVLVDKSVRIYSIRDESGNPHVSMELTLPRPAAPRRTATSVGHGRLAFTGESMAPDEFVRSPEHLVGYFTQILGKQNEQPIEEYRERAREFIAKVLDHEGVGWVLAGGAPAEGRFAERDLAHIDWPELIRVNGVEDDILTDAHWGPKAEYTRGSADFSRADLAGSNFRGMKMQGVDFSDAHMNRATLDEADLSGAIFDKAKLPNARFVGANCEGASFREADLTSAAFQLGARLRGADFSGAWLEGADFRDVNGARLATWEGAQGLPRPQPSEHGRSDEERRARLSAGQPARGYADYEE